MGTAIQSHNIGKSIAASFPYLKHNRLPVEGTDNTRNKSSDKHNFTQ